MPEPRRRTDQRLASVVWQTYVAGNAMRRIDDLVRELGLEGIICMYLTRICQRLCEQVRRFSDIR